MIYIPNLLKVKIILTKSICTDLLICSYHIKIKIIHGWNIYWKKYIFVQYLHRFHIIINYIAQCCFKYRQGLLVVAGPISNTDWYNRQICINKYVVKKMLSTSNLLAIASISHGIINLRYHNFKSIPLTSKSYKYNESWNTLMTASDGVISIYKRKDMIKRGHF